MILNIKKEVKKANQCRFWNKKTYQINEEIKGTRYHSKDICSCGKVRKIKYYHHPKCKTDEKIIEIFIKNGQLLFVQEIYSESINTYYFFHEGKLFSRSVNLGNRLLMDDDAEEYLEWIKKERNL